MRSFILIWIGQLVSLLGSGLTGFALGVWVYQGTGSVTQFALISLFAELPGILISPFAGALVDRWNRRWAMILSDTGAALMTLVIAILLFVGHLELWHIYLANAVGSLFSAFQWPAYTAATTLLVPKQQLGRASGLVQLGQAASQLLAPVLAGFLLGLIQLHGIILLDFGTFFVALITLLFVRIPKIQRQTVGKKESGGLLLEISEGWNYITTRPGLLGLLALVAADNFLIGAVSILVTPLVLSFSSPAVLGTLLSIGGAGMVAGSLFMSSWGGPRRLIDGVLVFNLLAGLSIFGAGWQPSIPLLALCAFLFFFTVPIINGCNQVIWQRKVDHAIQGRVFAFRRAITWFCLPFAYLLAGPLADRVFEPLMTPPGVLANSIGQIIGVGPGRGIGLMFILMGMLTILVAGIGYHFPWLRNVERDLPDAINEQ